MNHPNLVCFGEILWDVLPTGKIAGGAPMNVAYHANNMGLTTTMISRAGDDESGRELIGFLNGKGLDTGYIQTDPVQQTGIVQVTLNEKGSATYEIVQPVAWDYINITEEAVSLVSQADAFVFGSLACRNTESKNTLLKLIESAKLKVFDVNLRTPFYDVELVEELLLKADVLKLNDEELEIIAAWIGIEGDELEQAEFVRTKYRIDTLILTKGRKGAVCLTEEGYHSHPGFSIKVKDTIGAGDAFLAAFMVKTLNGFSVSDSLEFACGMGALAATKAGGMPEITQNEIQNFIPHSAVYHG
ncbi:MAG TPA: carbohydrate kinase [Catalimonadaceae bacterium]|nr:carbohydrate kinase [Catalimonadaceae bacterium]